MTLFCADNGNGSDVGWDNKLCAVFAESSWGKAKKFELKNNHLEVEKQHINNVFYVLF